MDSEKKLFSEEMNNNNVLTTHPVVYLSKSELMRSSVASPTISSRQANICVFIDCENNQFLKTWMMIIVWNLHTGTKL